MAGDEVSRDEPGPEVHVLAPDRFAGLAAARVAELVTESIATRGSCRLALSGGSTPAPVYRALGRRDDVDWGAVEVFWSDERFVSPDDPESNFRLADESLLEAVRPRRVEPMPVELGTGEAASAYETALGDEPLDVVLLGLGADGHTASLFPGSPALDETDALVAVTRAPTPPRVRLTLTLRALNEARVVLFLVTGAAKADRVAETLGGAAAGPRLPAARVRPAAGRLVWLVDEAASSRIRRTESA